MKARRRVRADARTTFVRAHLTHHGFLCKCCVHCCEPTQRGHTEGRAGLTLASVSGLKLRRPAGA
eukprot:13130557-Alexandrium_andersonii.AAC.1